MWTYLVLVVPPPFGASYPVGLLQTGCCAPSTSSPLHPPRLAPILGQTEACILTRTDVYPTAESASHADMQKFADVTLAASCIHRHGWCTTGTGIGTNRSCNKLPLEHDKGTTDLALVTLALLTANRVDPRGILGA